MSWLKIPKGSDDQLTGIPKMVLFYFVIPVGLLFLLVKVWPFLEKKLEGRDPQNTKADETLNTVSQTAGSVWDGFLAMLPWLIGLLILLPFAYIGGKWLLSMIHRKQALKHVRYIRILPSDDILLDIEKVLFLNKTFGEMGRHWKHKLFWGSPWFRIRFAMPQRSQAIEIYLAFPQDKKSSVMDAIRGIYPGAEIHDLKPSQFPEPTSGGVGGHFTFEMGDRKGLPLASLEQKKVSQLGDILNTLRPGTFLDLQFTPVSWKELEKRTKSAYKELKDKKMKDLDPEEKTRKVNLIKRMTGREITFKVRLSLWSHSPQAASVVRSTAESITTAMNFDGALRFWIQKRWNPLLDRNPIPMPIPGTFMIWTGEEMANLFHLPPGDHWIYQEPDQAENDPRGYLLHISQNQRSLAPDEWTEGVLIGNIKHPMYTREVRVPYEQLGKHFLLSGASGMGKSSAAIEMIQSIVDEWVNHPEGHPGLTIIDPQREIVAIIENRLRTLEQQGVKIPKEKIHHFNLSTDTTHVVGLNLLQPIPGVPINEVAEEIAQIILHDTSKSDLYIRSKRLLAMAIHSLLEDDHPHTVLGIDDFLRNEEFRKNVLKNGKDPYVKRYWAKFDQQLKEELEPILAEIDLLLQDPIMRRIYLQKQSPIDVTKIMNEGHLVFFDLYGMQLNEVRVTVGHLVHLYRQMSKQREFGSNFHLLFIDDAHLTQIPVIIDLLSEDSKYDFGVGLLTREIDQFENPELMQAMKSNIGMILSCGQTEGSDEIESLTRGSVKASFLEKLPERNVAVYLRTKKNQRSHSTTCVIENKPAVVYLPDGKIADYRSDELAKARSWGLEWGLEIMKQSSEARPIEELDPEIAKYMTETNQSSKE